MNKIINSKISHESKIYSNVEIKDSILTGKSSAGDYSIIRECLLETAEIGRYSKIINSKIGKSTYVGTNCFIAYTTIGKYCSLAWNISIGGVDHSYHRLLMTPLHRIIPVSEEQYEDFRKELIIGNDVWIGANSVIKRGVHIGDGAIIGAGSVVTHNVEPYSIVCGNPAKLLKYRFSKEIIEKLLQIKIWDYSDSVLVKIPKSYYTQNLTIELLNDLEKEINLIKNNKNGDQ